MKKFIMAAMASGALLFGGAVYLNTTGDAVAEARQSAKSIVDSAKDRGEVGERIDGYLEARPGASASVRAAVDEINIGRKSVYQRLAREQNVRLEVVAQLTGERQIANAAPGHWVKDASGTWSQK